MSAELRNRARAWLSQPQRLGTSYAADSMADWFLASYATNGHVDLSGDWLYYLRSGVAENLEAAERSSSQDAAFFREAAEILKAVEEETQP